MSTHLNKATQILWQELLAKKIGTFGKTSPADPFRPYPPAEDLRPGWGIPKGWEGRYFVITENADDPRLTPKALDRIAMALRYAADQWVNEKCRHEKMWCCETPEVRLELCDDKIRLKRIVNFVLTAYVYPPLTAKVDVADMS